MTIRSGSMLSKEIDELDTLLRISAAVHSVQALYSAREADARELLERQLLELIFESVPAECGAILILSELREMPGQVVGWSRISGRHAIEIDRDMAERAMAEGNAAVRNAPGQCAIAMPLTSGSRVLGAIYLASSNANDCFEDKHVELLTAIAGITGMALENARYVEWLESENWRLRAEHSVEHGMVGESAALRRVCRIIGQVAPSETTVLICGESGTGKELVARAIHENSPRRGKPFVAVNCAAVTETLLESEFFGHERGSFTGAIAQKRGKFELAEGGTLFLDEVGEMTPGLQSKLLRVLQERMFERVGGSRTIQVNVRIVAATNRDLKQCIAQHSFRADLFYRLNVVTIQMPPLRERREDIPLLARFFAGRAIAPEARACLLRYSWPGNVRELQNAMEHAVVLGDGGCVRLEDLPASVRAESVDEELSDYQSAVEGTRKQSILQAVERTGGNLTEAAHLLGVHPNYLHRLIRKYDLRAEIKRI